MDSYIIDFLSKHDYGKDYKFNRDELIWEHFNFYIPFNTNNPNIKIWQKFKTPESICDQLVNEYKDKYYPYDNILVMFNPEIIRSIIKNFNNVNLNKIYFISDNEEKTKWVNAELPEIKVKQLKSYTPKSVKETMKEFEIKKFDCVFSNPPYNKNADLKILKEIKNMYNYAVIVHPAGYLLDKKFKSKIYNEIRNTNHLEKVILFDGNKIFNIALYHVCCISIWNNLDKFENVTVVDTAITKSTYFCNINNISKFGNFSKFIKLNNKIKEVIKINGSLSSNVASEDKLSFNNIFFNIIKGNNTFIKKNYQENFISINDIKNIKNNYEKNKILKLCWSFNSEKERENFLNYCKTKVARFFLLLRKNNQHLDSGELDLIPWMDFRQEWNDKKLVEYFEITEEEWEYINKLIPNYYDDYVSGF